MHKYNGLKGVWLAVSCQKGDGQLSWGPTQLWVVSLMSNYIYWCLFCSPPQGDWGRCALWVDYFKYSCLFCSPTMGRLGPESWEMAVCASTALSIQAQTFLPLNISFYKGFKPIFLSGMLNLIINVFEDWKCKNTVLRNQIRTGSVPYLFWYGYGRGNIFGRPGPGSWREQ